MLRILPDILVNQIAAGEVVERPASVVKELVENALDAGADQIMVDVLDGGRTMINVIDNGGGMSRNDLPRAIMRHATSKLPTDDLLNINFMGFRGEALPSIASVSDMTIDTFYRAGADGCGWTLDATTGEVKPSSWESGTRVRIQNLFKNTPARLKFLRSDRAEMMSIVETVKRLALSRPDVGFALNQKWFFQKDQPLIDRIVSVMGDEVKDQMIEINANDGALKLSGFISKPTMRRASSVDQYLFVNGRGVKDKVLVGALRAGYMDVMSAREFPLCALYLTVPPREVDVNVSPSKTEVHFLEPARIRSFIIRTIRNSIGVTLNESVAGGGFINPDYYARPQYSPNNTHQAFEFHQPSFPVNRTGDASDTLEMFDLAAGGTFETNTFDASENFGDLPPLGRVVGQIGNKYILAQNAKGLVIVDQHAAHERIVYERLRAKQMNRQPLLAPIIIKLKPEQVAAILEVADELSAISVSEFGDGAIAIHETPSDWDLNWAELLKDVASEVIAHGTSSKIGEKLHLKLANYACHHSVRAGQKLDYAQMDALLRDIESTERAGQCNHGRPVYRIIPFNELDGWFERI